MDRELLKPTWLGVEDLPDQDRKPVDIEAEQTKYLRSFFIDWLIEERR